MAKAKREKKPATLGALRQSHLTEARCAKRTVKEEMRENLLGMLKARKPLFPGIVGYKETVIPQIVNAILSRHHMILLGLRGQAKSRILRGLTAFLDEEIPTIEGCEIHDNPYAPLCAACQQKLAAMGDDTPITFIPRDHRYVEKLATPDVTVADLIGDIDPIRAARAGLDLSSPLTIHFGLLPRANRGIFAINELPDLAAKVQVALFNIMQEGDVQIKGYPVRLPLDVCLVFAANPEDYTARGKIITPLRDRVGSEIRTHYPLTIEDGVAITAQEAWLGRDEDKLYIPPFLFEIVERIAFLARESKYIDKRSGVSQRLPITCIENVVSNAERRALLNREKRIVPRPADIYAALPAITGKLELEYEGELRGADTIARGLVREAIGHAFTARMSLADCLPIVEWFNQGGEIQIADSMASEEVLRTLLKVSPLLLAAKQLKLGEQPETLVSGCDFILEGLHALQKINRSEERGYFVERRVTETPPTEREADQRRRYYN
ncbi:MAG: sigma 54-interacting transcriptional regulator [candidate division NC10 bacterium]|jgi:magnesium chelatase subunit I|nr:sigma 54-interacting transcriptional regulator [candidate division NC10 bacterium]